MGGEAEQELSEDEGKESGIGHEGGRISRERDAYAEDGLAGGTPDDEVLPAGSEGVALDVPCDGCVVGEEESDRPHLDPPQKGREPRRGDRGKLRIVTRISRISQISGNSEKDAALESLANMLC